MMLLRALTLMVVLGLHSSAGAAAGLFHLCQGQAQLPLSCCCDQEGNPLGTPQQQQPALGASHGACCTLPAVHQAPTPSATLELDKRWVMPPALAAASPVLTPTSPANMPGPYWERVRGGVRSTAPPLYLQHRIFLI